MTQYIAIQKIDFVLVIISENEPGIFMGDIATKFKVYNENIGFGELRQIINKLEKDGFIVDENKEEKYRVTFEGSVWLEKKGYQGQNKRDKAMETRNRNLYFQNWILATGTFGLLLFEVWKFYYENYVN